MLVHWEAPEGTSHWPKRDHFWRDFLLVCLSSDFLESLGPGKSCLVSPLCFRCCPCTCPSGNLSQEAAGPGGTVFVPLEETSVESLLQTSAKVLAKLQVPGSNSLKLWSKSTVVAMGPSVAPTIHWEHTAQSVVLKTLKGKRRGIALLFLF